MLFQNVKIRKRRGKVRFFVWVEVTPKTIFCLCAIIFSLALNACRNSQKVDLRRLTPAGTIVYLETNNLAKTLAAITENQAFRELADQTPDFSALENVQLAIAVTGFETSENQVSDENSVINFTPRFVAVAETHAWQWQTVALAENQLDNFVRETYGADAALEKSDKPNGKFFAWTAKDGRKVFAFVAGSQIYFGNDLAAIEKRISDNPADNQSLADGESFSRADPENSATNLAFGYVSSIGIAQIANLAGVSVAVETTEESNGRSFIARILPQILQNTTQEIVWTASKTERGIEDKFVISLKPEVTAVTKETLTTTADLSANSAEFLPAEFFSATRYKLKSPLIAWRSLLFLTAKNTDALSGQLLMRFSGALLEPYGVADAEKFLNSIDAEIVTMQFDAGGEASAAIVTVKNVEELKKSIVQEIVFKTAPTMQFNAAIWFSENKQSAAAFIENKLVLGESSSVTKCLQAKENGRNFTQTRNFQKFNESRAAAVTFGRDMDSIEKIVEVLAKRNDENRKLATFYTTETRFTQTGIERKTVSDFGLIGTILKQLSR